MKKVLMFVFLFSIVATLYPQTTINVVCEDKEDFPSVLGNSTEIVWSKPGATVEALKILEKRLGVIIKIRRLPWKRALEEELKNGTADMIFTASYKKEREAFGVYPTNNGTVDETKCLYFTSYYFYKLKTSSADWDGKNLKNIKGNIGAPRGYSIVDDLKKMGHTVDESPDTLTDLKKLTMGRVDAVAALELTADVLIQNNPDLEKNIVKITTPIAKKAYFIMLSHQFVKKNPELAAKIWDEIKYLRENEYKKIAAKYIK